MYFAKDSLDDLLRNIFSEIIRHGQKVSASRGDFLEVRGALLVLKNPLARLSRSEAKGTIFSCLGELLWYLAGANDLAFISHYIDQYRDESDDGQTIHGAYGPRFFNMRGEGINQVANVVSILREKPSSRRAVIQLFDAEDIVRDHKEVPCTCTLQFFIRDRKLEMLTHMRSNDAFKGFPHDVFAFTMLQEIIARTLCIELGEYKHCVGSFHIYEGKDQQKASKFIDEGFQAKVIMPSMPQGDPWQAINLILKAEEQVRLSKPLDVVLSSTDDYWVDLIKLLQVYALPESANNTEFDTLKSGLSQASYRMFVNKRRDYIERRREANAIAGNNSKELEP